MGNKHKTNAPPENILVIKLSALGDFIQALGPMRSIRQHHKNAKITLLTTKPFVKMAKESGYFDDVIVDQRPRLFEFAKWIVLRNMLQETRYKHIYDLQNNSRVRRYYKRLFKEGFSWHSILNQKERREHASIRHKKILKRAGIDNISMDQLDWAGKNTDIKKLGVKAPSVLLVPGCDPTRPEKRWPAESYAEVAHYLVKQGIQPVVIGTVSEKREGEIIETACPEAINLVNKTSLFDIPALARGAEGAIGNDTGPMHMIGPTGCKSLVLFSFASDPVKHAPVGAHVHVLRKQELKDLSVTEVLDSIGANILL